MVVLELTREEFGVICAVLYERLDGVDEEGMEVELTREAIKIAVKLLGRFESICETLQNTETIN